MPTQVTFTDSSSNNTSNTWYTPNPYGFSHNYTVVSGIDLAVPKPAEGPKEGYMVEGVEGYSDLPIDLRKVVYLFHDGLQFKEWRLSFHELATTGLREEMSKDRMTPLEVSASKNKDLFEKTLQAVIDKEDGARAHLLRWANKDRTEESSKGIGWGCYTDEHKDVILKFLKQ